MNIQKINNSNTFKGFEITPVAQKLLDKTIDKAKNIDARKQIENLKDVFENSDEFHLFLKEELRRKCLLIDKKLDLNLSFTPEQMEEFGTSAKMAFETFANNGEAIVQSLIRQFDTDSPFAQEMSKYSGKINDFLKEFRKK